MTSEDIYHYLDDKASEYGTDVVVRGAKKFLQKRNLRRVGTTPTKRKPVPKPWTFAALVKQGRICPRCNKELLIDDATGDHKIPLILGGAHHPDNIQALHKVCNSSKGGNDAITESKKSGRLMKDFA